MGDLAVEAHLTGICGPARSLEEIMLRQTIKGRVTWAWSIPHAAVTGVEILVALMVLAGFVVIPARRVESFEDDFSTDTGRWIYKGWAQRDVVNEYVVLTTPTDDRWGIIWFDQDIIEPFHASFRYKAGGGSGADGLVFMFYKKTDYEPDWGGYLCFCSLPKSSHTPVPGYGIEYDNYYNGGHLNDPSSRHIALLKDRPGNHVVSVDDQRVEDFNWHTVEVDVEESSITVAVDDGQVLTWNGTIDRSYGGFGFAGATGNSNNWHIIDDVCVKPLRPEMYIDIKPRSCPNPLNTKSKGVLPVAILGTEHLDVTDIDLGTVLLEGVAPIRAAIEDVARPVEASSSVRGNVVLGGSHGDEPGNDRSIPVHRIHPVHGGGGEVSFIQVHGYAERCPCTTEGPDGFEDLTLKFQTQEIVAAIGAVNDRDTLELTLTARMEDGAGLLSSDCVVIIGGDGPKRPKTLSAQPQSVPQRWTDAAFSLLGAFPNPVTSQTVIKYQIFEDCDVEFRLHNSLGQKVLTVVKRDQEIGRHAIILVTRDYSPGVYFYQLRAGACRATDKLVVLR